jgi:hypothetical protein
MRTIKLMNRVKQEIFLYIWNTEHINTVTCTEYHFFFFNQKKKNPTNKNIIQNQQPTLLPNNVKNKVTANIII